jgi:hypothetical protein
VARYFKEILNNYDRLNPFNEIDIAGDHYVSMKEIVWKLYELIQCGSLTFDTSLFHEIDKNIVPKADVPSWLSVNQTSIQSSLRRFL